VSFYFWLTSANIYLAALAVIFDKWLVALGLAIFCMAIAFQRTRGA